MSYPHLHGFSLLMSHPATPRTMERNSKATVIHPSAERLPLLQHSDDQRRKRVRAVPMKYHHLPTATESIQKAFVNDPLMRYFVSADTVPFQEARQKLTLAVLWADAIRQHRMFTVDKGAAVMMYAPPGKRTVPWHIDLFLKFMRIFRTRELAKRQTEYASLAKMLVRDAMGDTFADMYELESLGTDPDMQGRGYGSALVNYLLEQSDAADRDVWLITTVAWPFYQQLGFTVVRVGLLGVNNPKWEGEPVMIRIMHRPAQKSVKPEDMV